MISGPQCSCTRAEGGGCPGSDQDAGGTLQ